MLSTLLSQLQSYFSKYFLIGSFCPVLVFTFLNGLTAYMLSAPWRVWADANIVNSGVGRGAFVMTSLAVGMVLVAYILSSLSTFLRRLLEGRWWNPLANLFIPTQNRRRELLIKDLKQALKNIADLVGATEWPRLLQDSRNRGIVDQPHTKFNPLSNDEFDKKLQDFERLESENRVVPGDQLEEAVKELSELLKKNNVDLDPYLDKQHQRLQALIDYARQRSQAHYARLLNELHSSFGAQEVEATKMGNIANTIQSYSLRRYQCNLEAIWSNLQRVVQRDENAQAALQESKTQLDFLVACCWLTLVWSAIWTVVFVLIAPSRIGFLTSALGGPALAYIWYRAAAEQYRSFADVAMTTLDSFRFALFNEMRLETPYDVENERYVWQSIDQLTTYEEERNFRYVKPTSS